MDMERVIQEAYDVGYHRGYEAGKFDGLVESNKADRPRGEWIIHDEMPLGWLDIKCSRCGSVYGMDEVGQYYNFCPNCGARMKGAEDE